MSEPYELTPRPAAPALPGVVVLRADADQAIDAIAADILIQAHNCVRSFGDFHLALSGGSTPQPLYERLMIDPRFRDLPWTRTHLWLVDERRVPEDDDKSNFRMIRETIVDHSGIPSEQVHPMPAMDDDADVAYERTLREVLGWREKGHDRLDCTVLGMGTDGHTASLFPHSDALKLSLRSSMFTGSSGPASAGVPLVKINRGSHVTPPERVTLMLPFINASRMIAVLALGTAKRAMLTRIVDACARERTPGPSVIESLPILGVRPLAGELRWYIDNDACPPTQEGSRTQS